MNEGLEVVTGPVPGTLRIRVQARDVDRRGNLLRGERGPDAARLRFERVLPVAADADTNSVKTTLRDGILVVTMKKRDPSHASPPTERTS